MDGCVEAPTMTSESAANALLRRGVSPSAVVANQIEARNGAPKDAACPSEICEALKATRKAGLTTAQKSAGTRARLMLPVRTPAALVKATAMTVRSGERPPVSRPARSRDHHAARPAMAKPAT